MINNNSLSRGCGATRGEPLKKFKTEISLKYNRGNKYLLFN